MKTMKNTLCEKNDVAIFQKRTILKKTISSPSEIVLAKQSSRFARTICSLSKLAQELLLMAIGTINVFPSKRKNYVEFSVLDFLKAFHKENYSTVQIHQQIFNAVMNELSKVICYENLEKYFENGATHYRGKAFALFTKAEVDTGKNIKLTFNDEAFTSIQEIKPYEIIEFEKAAQIKSKHAFNIYKYALSKQGFSGKKGNKEKTWWFDIEVEQLKLYLGVLSTDYSRMADFQKRCLENPINELNEKKLGIEIKWSSIKQGKKIVAFHFECKETVVKLKIEKTDSFAKKQEKILLNEEREKETLWKKMQDKYPKVWNEYFIFAKSKGFFVFDSVAKNEAYERMISEGFEI